MKTLSFVTILASTLFLSGCIGGAMNTNPPTSDTEDRRPAWASGGAPERDNLASDGNVAPSAPQPAMWVDCTNPAVVCSE